MNRRDFVQNALAGALASTAAQSSQAAAASKMIGIQVGAVSFVDEGVETGARRIPAGRRPSTRCSSPPSLMAAGSPGGRCPDSRCRITASRQYDTDTFKGGSYTQGPSAVLQGHRHQRFPRAGFRRLRRAGSGAAGGAQARHEDHLLVRGRVERQTSPTSRRRRRSASTGSNATTLCFNNPNYRNWLLGTVEDYTRSYEIDGIMWGSERQGAFANALGASHGGGGGGIARTTCFCQFCERKAQERGIDPARARAGFQALGEFVQARGRASGPVDGYYVTLWRLMLRYPELLALGDALDRQPARDLRRDVQQGEIDQALDRRGLAHLAQQLVQPDLSRRAGSLAS